MNCIEAPVRFRLLDGNVGWEPHVSTAVENGTTTVKLLYDSYGVRLDNRGEPRLSSELLSPFMPPATLAFGCRPGEWYLCGVRNAVTEHEAVLLHRDPCYERWIDLRPQLAEGNSLNQPLAGAFTRRRLAVVEAKRDGSHRILVWSIPDGRLAGLTEIHPNETPHAIAFASWHELMVSVERTSSESNEKSQWLLRYDLVGQPRGEIAIESNDFNTKHPLTRLRTANDGSLWAAKGDAAGPFDLCRISPAERAAGYVCEPRVHLAVEHLTDTDFYHHAEDQLKQAFRPTPLVSVGANHFCINEPSVSGEPKRFCFGCDGTPLSNGTAAGGIARPGTNGSVLDDGHR